jgi:hypothetical protein
VALVILIAGVTLLLPWWSVAVVGLLFGLLGPTGAKAWEAGLAGVFGWGVLLLIDAVQGPIGVLTDRLGVLFQVPGAVLLAVTVLFAGVLGWAGAGVGRAVSLKP